MKNLVLLLFSMMAITGSAEIIFVDINDAPLEIQACEAGLADKARKTGKAEPPLERTNGNCNDTGGIFGTDKVPRKERTDTYWCLRHKVKTMLESGRKIDSLVISGEDGNGQIFGRYKGNPGALHAHEIALLYEEFSELKSTLKSAALWGCYPTTVDAAEQYWLIPNQSMQFTMGFTLQGPDKERPANHALLRQFCEKREEAVEAAQRNALCEFYDKIQQDPLAMTHMGMCDRYGVASKDYAYPGMEDEDHCFTYEELHKRCGEFIPYYESQVKMYEDYRLGKRDDFEFDIYDRDGDGDKTEKSELRLFYDELQKWRHCADQLKVDRSFDMPYAPDVIRLIKSKYLQKHAAELHSPEFKQYDHALIKMGLASLALGDVSKLSRSELVEKIQGAVVATNELKGGTNSIDVTPVLQPKVTSEESDSTEFGILFSEETYVEAKPQTPAPVTVTKSKNGLVNNVDPEAVHRMAQCFRKTLVNTSWECVPPSWVGSEGKRKSRCLISYERAGELIKGENKDNDAC